VVLSLSYENEFSFTGKQNSRLWEKEAKDNPKNGLLHLTFHKKLAINVCERDINYFKLQS